MSLIHAKTALLPDGWAQDVTIRIAGGRIAEVTRGVAPTGHRFDCLLPAPVNLHSHTFQRAMAGLTEKRTAGQDSFWTWRALMYRFLEQLTPEDVEAIAAMVMIEMAEAGYGAVAEFHYLHHAPGGGAYADLAEMSLRVAAAAAETGFGLTHLPVLYERGGCDGRALSAGQRRFGNDPDRFVALWDAARHALQSSPPDTVLGVAPHSLRAVSRHGLDMAIAMDRSAPVHIHIAEQVAEVTEVLDATGLRPVDWLLQHQAVDARFCLVHATQMTPDETLALARSGAVVGLCPITEANLGDGIFDGQRFVQAGGRFGIGSDSNVRVSLTEELRLLEYSQRLGLKSRACLALAEHSAGRVLFEGAVKGGAQAAGRASGAITAGLWADLLALDLSGPDLMDASGDTILDTWIFARDDRLVTDLWSAGRHLVSAGRHYARDQVMRRYGATASRLRGAL
jgi:formimidoylglutamate deiminase